MGFPLSFYDISTTQVVVGIMVYVHVGEKKSKNLPKTRKNLVPKSIMEACVYLFTSLDDPFLKSPLVLLSCFKCAADASSVVSLSMVLSKCAWKHNSSHF